MSEKRILCFEMPLDCRECREDVFLSRCEICSPVKNKWPTREQAIEKMAKAICLADDDGGCKGCCGNKKCNSWHWYMPLAEAALNALLENKE